MSYIVTGAVLGFFLVAFVAVVGMLRAPGNEPQRRRWK